MYSCFSFSFRVSKLIKNKNQSHYADVIFQQYFKYTYDWKAHSAHVAADV